MVVYNETKGTILSSQHKLCTSTLSKARGLMFSKRKTLVFEFDNEQLVPLHNCFVFFPIDLLFLDSSGKIVELKNSFKPFTFYNPKNKSKWVVELPSGSIHASNTSLGDLITFRNI